MRKFFNTYFLIVLLFLLIGGILVRPFAIVKAQDAGGNVLISSCTEVNITFTIEIFALGPALTREILYNLQENTGSGEFIEGSLPQDGTVNTDSVNISLDTSAYDVGDTVSVTISAAEFGNGIFIDNETYTCTVTGIPVQSCQITEECIVANPSSTCNTQGGRTVPSCTTVDNFQGNCCLPTVNTIYPTPVPAPPGPHPNEYVACTETIVNYPGNSEFHTLRPYQASVCSPESPDALRELDLYCGNDIILVHELELTLAEAQALANEPCIDNGSTITCDITLLGERAEITVDLADAELPIAGNTQLVPNQVNHANPSPEKLSYATRMNEYVSWYLHGTSFKGDETLLDPEEIDITYPRKHIITYGGPLQKLYPRHTLPFDPYWLFSWLDYAPPNPRADRVGVANRQWTHDQIYICLSDDNQIPCRFNFATGQYHLLQDIRQTPLDPSDDVFTQSAVTRRTSYPGSSESYWMLWASSEDRLGAVFVDTKVTNPIAGTEIQPTSNEGNEAAVWNVDLYGTSSNSVLTDTDLLYFPHMEENITLTDLLQSTFVPLELPKVTGDILGEGKDTYNTHRCDLKDVRWNPGDDLYGELNDDWLPNRVTVPETPNESVSGNSINVTVQYDTNFKCVFNYSQISYTACYDACLPACSANPPDTVGQPVPPYAYPDCTSYCSNTCGGAPTCEVDIMTATQVFTRTPKVEELWDRTVSGETSIIKRMLPRIGYSGMIAELKDYPAVTSASYTTQTDDYVVYAGDPTAKRSGSDAEIYIPHLGGIKVFFMDTLQDYLRPREMNSLYIGSGPGGGLPPGSGGGTCSPLTSGLCSVDNLSSTFGSYASVASQICAKESGGNPNALNTSCLLSSDGINNDNDGPDCVDLDDTTANGCPSPQYDGATADYSVGLFQINLHPLSRFTQLCPGGFAMDYESNGTGDKPLAWCQVTNQAVVDSCVNQYSDVQTNIDEAYTLSNSGTSWCSNWGTALQCGLCGS